MSQLKNIKLNTPTYREIIPSSKKEIVITPFKVADEKLLLMASESKDSRQIVDGLKRVVMNCIKNEDVENLASFDLEYLFLKIRSVSVGETAEILLTCSQCNTANEHKIDLTKVQVENIENFVNRVKITDDLFFDMKLPDIETYSEITDTPDSMIRFIASNVSKVYYGEEVIDVGVNEIDDVVNIIEQLTSTQFEELQNYAGSIPKVSQDANYVCKQCGAENNTKLEGLSDFF